MAEKIANLARTTLVGKISAGATSLTVVSALNFPASGNFRLIVDSEILLVTAVSGTTFTITRASEETVASEHAAGAVVTHVLTAGSLSKLLEEQGATTGEGAPSKGLAKGVFYIQQTAGKNVALWRGKGAGEEPENAADLSGTPADGSVTAPKVAAANVDGAAGTPSLRSLDTDGTLAANSDTRVASQKAVKAYADNLLTASEAVVFKGVKDCSANPNYPAAEAGWLYRVSVAGKIGGASGVNVEIGDTLLCITDAAAGTQAEVGTKWQVIQANIDGAVIGPTSTVSGNLASYEGTAGKTIKDSGLAIDTDNTLAANSDSKIASQKATKGFVETQAGLLVPKSLGTTKGDLIGFKASGEPVRVPAPGADGHILQSDSTATSGASYLRRGQITASRPQKPPSGNFLVPTHSSTSNTQIAGTQTLYFLPIDLYEETIFSGIACYVGTKGVGTSLVARLGIFEDDGTGTRPKTLLFDAGTTSVEAEAERLIETERTIGAGRSWTAFVIQGTLTTGPFLTQLTTASALIGVPNLANSTYRGLKRAVSVAGALPAEAGTLEATGVTPLVGLKVK